MTEITVIGTNKFKMKYRGNVIIQHRLEFIFISAEMTDSFGLNSRAYDIWPVEFILSIKGEEYEQDENLHSSSL